jgi:hypothetical protein
MDSGWMFEGVSAKLKVGIVVVTHQTYIARLKNASILFPIESFGR